MLRFFDVSKGAGIRLARIGASLEAPQTVCDDGQQRLVGKTIDPVSVDVDGSILKQDDSPLVVILPGARIALGVESRYFVAMVGTTVSWVIHYRDGQTVVGRIDYVVSDFSHFVSS